MMKKHMAIYDRKKFNVIFLSGTRQNNFQVKDNRSNLEKLKATDKRLNELISQLPQ